MMRKSTVLVLVGLLTVALTSSVGMAENEDQVVYFEPFWTGQVYTVHPGQRAVIRWGWHACSKGLVTGFLKAIDRHEYTLNGEQLFSDTEEANEHWGPIQESWKYTPEVCVVGHGQHVWASPWEYDITDRLEPGDNTLHWTVSYRHRLTDGCDLNGDGRPDVWSRPT